MYVHLCFYLFVSFLDKSYLLTIFIIHLELIIAKLVFNILFIDNYNT